jgi:hypothetical protein
LRVSQRRACRVLGQSRRTQRYLPRVRDDEGPLTARVIELAGLYGRYGTPRIVAPDWHYVAPIRPFEFRNTRGAVPTGTMGGLPGVPRTHRE